MRRRAVAPTADITDGFSVRGNAKFMKGPAHRCKLANRAGGHLNAEDSVRVLIRLGVVRRADDDAVTRRKPREFLYLPIVLREGLGFAGCERQQPESHALVFLVGNMRVVFVFFLFFFGFGFGIGSQKRNLLAVWRPSETLHAALAFGKSHRFATISSHDIDLLIVVAIREKCELFAIGRPARRDFGLSGIGELADAAGLLVIKPDVTRTALALRWFRHNKCKSRAVWRELKVGDRSQVERSFWGQDLRYISLVRLLSEERFYQDGEGEEGADAKAPIHLGLLQGWRERLYLWAWDASIRTNRVAFVEDLSNCVALRRCSVSDGSA